MKYCKTFFFPLKGSFIYHHLMDALFCYSQFKPAIETFPLMIIFCTRFMAPSPCPTDFQNPSSVIFWAFLSLTCPHPRATKSKAPVMYHSTQHTRKATTSGLWRVEIAGGAHLDCHIQSTQTAPNNQAPGLKFCLVTRQSWKHILISKEWCLTKPQMKKVHLWILQWKTGSHYTNTCSQSDPNQDIIFSKLRCSGLKGRLVPPRKWLGWL